MSKFLIIALAVAACGHGSSSPPSQGSASTGRPSPARLHFNDDATPGATCSATTGFYSAVPADCHVRDHEKLIGNVKLVCGAERHRLHVRPVGPKSVIVTDCSQLAAK